jgi:hypothetical protein
MSAASGRRTAGAIGTMTIMTGKTMTTGTDAWYWLRKAVRREREVIRAKEAMWKAGLRCQEASARKESK